MLAWTLQQLLAAVLTAALTVTGTYPLRPVLACVSKALSCATNLRTAFDEGNIRLPSGGYWAEVQKQCLNYKLVDRKQEQDLVMCLAIVVKLSRSLPRPGQAKASGFVFGDKEADRELSAAEVMMQGYDPRLTTFQPFKRPT